MCPMPAAGMEYIEPEEDKGFELDVPRKFQPDFESSRQYSHEEMEALAEEVLIRIENQLAAPFNRRDPQHVWALAEFFGLTPQEELDPYSTPMEEGDAYYFAEVETHQHTELYPQTANQLVIRFYWEGLARLGAAYYQLEVVNERKARNPVKSRGKVSDMATTAMFDKRPGITVAEAVAQGKERYDLERLARHLKVKGLPASTKAQ